MRFLGRWKRPDIHHSQARHILHDACHVDKDLLRRVDDHQRCVRWRLCCQVCAVWWDGLDRRYVLRVGKHLLCVEPVLLAVSLSLG